jgi:iron complex outermembrane receptor protein/vitamin B12 transporter
MRRSTLITAAGVLVVVLSALAVPGRALAQPPATVAGTVTDPLGARVPDITVTLTGGAQPRDTMTASDGSFTFTNVAPGLYRVAVMQEGFQPFTSDPVYVSAGASQTVRAVLQVSPLEQSVVVTAAATGISQAQTGAPVTVLDASTLDALNKPDVLEALRLVPGAQVVQAGARGGQASLFIRGGAANFNKVLIDGAVANDIGGEFDFAQLSTTGVDRVEILRQTNSVMYGSDALAGVVTVDTKRGRTRVPQFTYAADAGGLGTWSSDAGVGGVVKRFNYYSGYRWFETDNDVPNNDYRNGAYAGRFGLSLGANTDISGTLHYADTDAGSPNGFTLFGIADDSRSKTRLTYGTLNVDAMPASRWQTSVRFGTTDRKTFFFNPAASGEPYDPFGFGAVYLGNQVTLTGANGYRVTGRGILDFGGTSAFESQTTRNALSGKTTLAVNNSLTISGGARYERESALTCSTAVDCLDAFSDGERDGQKATRNNGGVFVEGRGTIMNRHYISAGLGVEHNEVFGEAVTPRISVASYLRQPAAGGAGDTKLVLNAGTGIKAPSVAQQQSSVFELVQGTAAASSTDRIGPERSQSFDVGIEQGLMSHRARLRVAYFHNTFHDLIEFLDKSALVRAGVPVSVANATAFGGYVNSQSYTAQGAEISFDAYPRADLKLMASYTRLNAEVTEAFGANEAFNPAFPGIAIGAFSPLVGARPFRRAANSGTFAVMYTPSRYEVSLATYFAGKRDDSTFLSDSDFGNSLLLPNRDLDRAYQKVDLSAAADVRPHLRVYTTVENLLDQDYEASFGFPALPLTARFGVKVTLGGDGRR